MPISKTHDQDMPAVTMRQPTPEDGPAIWRLVRDCPPLDVNSMYFNLIQCDHFRDTCIVAETDGNVVGWISGHIPPNAADTLFIWQVAVAAQARGRGLAQAMLRALVARPVCRTARRIQTTITDDNAASWATFAGFSRQIGGGMTSTPYFDRDTHFGGAHETENLVTIPLHAAADQGIRPSIHAANQQN